MLPVLRTPRLILRPVVEGDVADVWRLLTDADVRRYLCDDLVFPRATVAAIVAEHLALAPRGMGLWVIEQDGAFAGIAGLKTVALILGGLGLLGGLTKLAARFSSDHGWWTGHFSYSIGG